MCFKKFERTQNAIDADISFCKWLQNKLNMWTLYDCKTKKEVNVCKFVKNFLATFSAYNEMDREKITREVLNLFASYPEEFLILHFYM